MCITNKCCYVSLCSCLHSTYITVLHTATFMPSYAYNRMYTYRFVKVYMYMYRIVHILLLVLRRCWVSSLHSIGMYIERLLNLKEYGRKRHDITEVLPRHSSGETEENPQTSDSKLSGPRARCEMTTARISLLFHSAKYFLFLSLVIDRFTDLWIHTVTSLWLWD